MNNIGDQHKFVAYDPETGQFVELIETQLIAEDPNQYQMLHQPVPSFQVIEPVLCHRHLDIAKFI